MPWWFMTYRVRLSPSVVWFVCIPRMAGLTVYILPLATDAKSFQNTRKWIDDVRAERGNDVIVVLVGNKTDLSKREVTTQQGEDEAKKNNLMFVETSAKLGHNVKTLFKRIAQALPGMEGTEAASRATNQVIDVKTNNQPSQDGCSC